AATWWKRRSPSMTAIRFSNVVFSICIYFPMKSIASGTREAGTNDQGACGTARGVNPRSTRTGIRSASPRDAEAPPHSGLAFSCFLGISGFSVMADPDPPCGPAQVQRRHAAAIARNTAAHSINSVSQIVGDGEVGVDDPFKTLLEVGMRHVANRIRIEHPRLVQGDDQTFQNGDLCIYHWPPWLCHSFWLDPGIDGCEGIRASADP